MRSTRRMGSRSGALLLSLWLSAGCDSGEGSSRDTPDGAGGAGGAAPTDARPETALPADTATAPADAAVERAAADTPPPVDGAPPADVAVDRSLADAATGGDAAGTAPAPGEYGTRANLIEPNSEMAIAVVGTKIYVLGGYPSSRMPVNSLQIYDTMTNTWSGGAPYPTTIHHPVIAGVGGKLYSLGGQITINGGDTGRSYEYDPAMNRWRELAPMPTPRGAGAAAVIGDTIYVVGGRPPANNELESYTVSTNTWKMLAKLPARFAQRNHLAAGAIGGKVYVAGGRYNGGGFGDPRTDALDMYDPATNIWTSKRPMLRVRGGMSGVVAFGCFHVYGGEGQGIGEPNDVYPDHDVYDPRTDTWVAVKKLAVPFHGVTGGAFVDGLIHMPGGGTMSGGSSGTRMHQVYRAAMRCE